MENSHTSSNALGIKSLLGTETLSHSQIRTILDCASVYKTLWDQKKAFPKSPLSEKTVSLLFFENSTRTRGSFELAAKRLGANTMVLTQDGSSTKKGETLYDTAKTIEAMAPHVLVLRHASAGSPHHLDRILNLPVINAGDGFHEHPTQALLDLMTIEDFRGQIAGLKVLIVGDIAHSRVARSNIYALKTMGATVSVCGPRTLLPPKVEKLGVNVFDRLDQALEGQDVVMLLRIQTERLTPGQIPSQGEYTRFYGVNGPLLRKYAKPDVLIMHPGPINRGVELTPEVADGPHSVILNQVANGVLLRMAVLHLLVGGEALRRNK